MQISKTFNNLYLGQFKPRQGWLKRGIPLIEVETIGTHIKNCEVAGRIYSKNFPHINTSHLARILGVHDYPEWHPWGRDYTPGEVSKEQKLFEEILILRQMRYELEQIGSETYALVTEYNENKTPEAQMAHNLDKMDAAVRAVQYDHGSGYTQVRDFYPYTMDKVSSDPILQNILQILIRGEYKDWATAHLRYFILLQLNGKEDAYHEFMKNRKKFNCFETRMKIILMLLDPEFIFSPI